MKQVVNKTGIGLLKTIAALSIMVTYLNVNVACAWITHQPMLPKGSEKLKKN